MKNKGISIIKTPFLILILLGLSSCQFFETEKIATETFLEDEIKSINWKDIDTYPIFKECEGISDKLETKSCFETTLSNHLYQTIKSDSIVVSTDLNETIIVDFMVSEKGELSITNMVIDSLLQSQLPFFESDVINGLDSLQPIAPAYKRGIPVKTTFKLPIVIKTNS